MAPPSPLGTPPPPTIPPAVVTSPSIDVQNLDQNSADDDATSIATRSHVLDSPDSQQLASPLRHHKRTPSAQRIIKETLDARAECASEDEDEYEGVHRHVNQYVLVDEIGRGSWGAVHLGKDHTGKEYAVKEFSKARLRKLAQSNILKRGPGRQFRQPVGGSSPNSPLTSDMAGARAGEKEDALYLIRKEIAVMKKLDHINLVQLHEILDDPEQDSLYMVMEMCHKGSVMHMGLGEQRKPYGSETCRHWFRDLILGVEYLHEQGIIHRDIKPDNLLISADNILKVADFGVSEIVDKPTGMLINKSAGSPAFLSPELCDAHGQISGSAADIWSMGVSLYCLIYGLVPFQSDTMLGMYEAIKTEDPIIPSDEDPTLTDLFLKILDKNPKTRITMDGLREHPWVTKAGKDSLLPRSENCAHQVEPPSNLEISHAFTRRMNHLLCVMKAIQRFKALVRSSRKGTPLQSPGVARQELSQAEIEATIARRRQFMQNGNEPTSGHNSSDTTANRPTLFLGIGPGGQDDFAPSPAISGVVSESPTAVALDIYNEAFVEAVERIRSNSLKTPTIHETRFVHPDRAEQVRRNAAPVSANKVREGELVAEPAA